jgi:hypothetical protein
MFRHLTEQQVLAWADAYREATGSWPTKKSGAVASTVCETWAGIDRALREGRLGLPGGSSLARFLADKRGARCATFTPPLTLDMILAWADAHHAETGDWPSDSSGRVRNVSGERWAAIDDALRRGSRGLPGCSSLARLLAEQRGARNLADRPDLNEEQILTWVDRFHEQTGKWPTENSGLIPASGGESWVAIDNALRRGIRGLPGGSSLPRLLAEQRGVRNKTSAPPLSEALVLEWADDHFRRTGRWPVVLSGPVLAAPAERWTGINVALARGLRGLPGGTTLARLLSARRNVRNHMALPPLERSQILTWADAHFQRTGDWPTYYCGPIPEAPGETWRRVEQALRAGLRGLPGRSSLAQLLAQQRGKRNIQELPPLSKRRILAWAEAHRQRTGDWPDRNSGPIPEAPGESWSAVNTALQDGLRGLPEGSSLARLLARKRGVRNRKDLPVLTVAQVLFWADHHHEQTRRWPTHSSGPISGARGETWRTVDKALTHGGRGLPGGSSLFKLLAEHRGKRWRTRRADYTLATIRAWIEDHRRQTGNNPTAKSGPVLAAPGETWNAVNCALRRGGRGLPGGSSLADLVE